MVAFQLVCLVFLPLAYASFARVEPAVWRLFPVIFVASWIGEASSIHLYGFYQYSEAWWFRVAGVPLLIPAIWPMVILSGRAVIRTLWPAVGRWEPLAVAVIVFFDAAMVEVVAVQCGLWSWTEPGYLGVPLIGVLGWAYFGGAAAYLLRETQDRARLSLIVGAPAMLHVLLVASWWTFFRWFWRGEWFWLFALVVVSLSIVAQRVRAQRRMSLDIAWARMLAAGIFVALLAFTPAASARTWLHVALTSIPYALVTNFQRNRFSGKPA